MESTLTYLRTGSRIVYTSCQYPTVGLQLQFMGWPPDRDLYNYEIVTVAMDGSAPERLTTNWGR